MRDLAGGYSQHRPVESQLRIQRLGDISGVVETMPLVFIKMRNITSSAPSTLMIGMPMTKPIILLSTRPRRTPLGGLMFGPRKCAKISKSGHRSSAIAS
jgi:hypothetical protein